MVLSVDTDDKKDDGKTKLELKSVEYPPYDAVIPYQSTKYLTYGLQLVNLKHINAFPTRLESTS